MELRDTATAPPVSADAVFSTQQFERPGRILLVNADPAASELFKDFLERHLHSVAIVKSAREALQAASDNGPEIIILSAALPDGNGFEICRRLKQDDVQQYVPVIMIADQADRGAPVRASESGANDFLSTPMDLTLFESRIRAQLKYRRALALLRQARVELEKRVLERTEQLSSANLELEREVNERRRAEHTLQEVVARAHCVLWDAQVTQDGGNFAWEMRVHSSDTMRRELAIESLAGESTAQMWARLLSGVSREQLQRMNSTCHSALLGGSPSYQQEFAIRASDGSTRWLTERVEITPKDPSQWSLVGVATDITERKRVEEALRASEERYALAAEGANDGLWDWDLRSQELYLSPRWKRMIGEQAETVTHTPDEWFKRVHALDLERLKADIEMHLSQQTPYFQSEYRIRHRDGSYRWMLSRGMAVRSADEKPHRMVGSQTDITARKLAEIQLMLNAFHDVLTGLPNRALFKDRLGQTIRRAQRHADYKFAVLFVGVDRFKVVNESLGRGGGDQVLMAIGQKLARVLHSGDTVAHLHGDEFAVLLDDLEDLEEARQEALRIQQDLARPFTVAGQEVFITAGIGLAFGTGYLHPEDALRDAAAALHSAKSKGKQRTVVFDAQTQAKASTILQMDTDLRRALVRQELILHYQPIVSLGDGKLAGFEALVRWQKPNAGLIHPNEFIAVAEDTGLIIPLSWWALRQACRQIRNLRGAKTLFVNVNLSSKMLTHPDLIPGFQQVLEETGLDPRKLKLEITESALMEYSDAATSALRKLKELNLRLVLDDFGTGYSSLSYLHRFPFDVLKIDRSFICLLGSGENSEIVRTIVTLAQNLKLETVAEGVETKEQFAQLKAMKCQFAQGYYFAKALDASALEKWMEASPRW